MELETTFYIIGIICMTLITLILIGIIVLIFVIKAKITHLQNSLQAKVRPLTQMVDKAEDMANKVVNKLRK